MKRLFQPLSCTAFILYAFLYVPLAVIVASSLNESRYGTEWRGLTLRWYRSVLADEQILAALKNTAILATVSTLVATLLGSLLGYGMSRHRFPLKRFAGRALFLSIGVPDIIMAVSLLLFYALLRSWLGLFHLSLSTMILAHVTFQIPFVALLVQARLKDIDPSLEEAAHDLGASRWQRFRFVTLPLLGPGIIAGALLAFTLSLDDFVVSFFTSGPGSATVPIYIYASVKRGVTAEVHALSSLLIYAGFLATVGMALLQNRRAPPATTRE